MVIVGHFCGDHLEILLSGPVLVVSEDSVHLYDVVSLEMSPNFGLTGLLIT